MMRALLLAATLLLCSAHVGSPDVWYDGAAGPYPIRVRVTPPEVVPGLASVVVRVRGGATRVTVAPARSDSGDEGQPAADVALADPADADVFSAQLWLMARGAYRIVVQVSGPRGDGSAIVPVTATATTRRPMSPATTWALLAAAAFLFVGLLSIIGAAAREAVLAPGLPVTRERLHRGRRAILAGAALITLVLFGGWRWWRAVDTAHVARLDRAWAVTTRIDSSGVLTFRVTDDEWTRRGAESPFDRRGITSIVPDHGKLMHMFLVRDDQSAFAHVHPTTADQVEFRAVLPHLPAGSYRVYGDIVHESGYTRTLVDTVEIAHSITNAAVDADDTSWDAATGLLDAGLRWIGPGNITAGQEVDIGAEAVYDTGAPVVLQPYMGMPGHAVVERDDGSVFVHLHPLGTISMAAQSAVAARTSAHGVVHAPAQPDAVGNRVTFPYAFPTAGLYRVWIQVRTSAGVLTERFDVIVQ